MKRKTSLLAAPTLVVAATFALTATAQQVTPSPSTTTTSPAQPVAPATTMPRATSTMTPAVAKPPASTSTTTLTAGEPPAETIVGMPPSEPRAAETVTVDRGLRPNRPLLITGAILLVGTYVPTAIVEQSSGRAVEDSNLLIPIVGPWVNLADRRCDNCDNETRNKVFIVGSGVVQGVGAAMSILSLFVPEKIAAATIQAGPMKFQVAPTQIGRSGMGLGTVGVF